MGTLRVQVGKTFQLDEIVEAHRCMEENKSGWKNGPDLGGDDLQPDSGNRRHSHAALTAARRRSLASISD